MLLSSLSAATPLVLAAYLGSSYGASVFSRGPKLSRAYSLNGVVANDAYDDIIYTVDVFLGGKTYVVQVDSGSSDLWIYTDDPPQIKNQTDVFVKEKYGIGSVQGTIAFAELQFGEFIVPNQAFIYANYSDNPVLQYGAVGIIGLAFDDVEFSPINNALRHAWGADTIAGRSPLSSIFYAYPDASNSYDIALHRQVDEDARSTPSATLFIGEHLEGYDNVTQQPRLPRRVGAGGTWSIVMDSMSINARPRTWKSVLSGVPDGKSVALLDTGSSTTFLPAGWVNDLYANIPGAIRVNDTETGVSWFVPCDTAANISFTFAGIEYPVHPLDLTHVETDIFTIDGKQQNVTFCSNSYDYNDQIELDAVLGDPFLKNVYASFDYGETESSGNNAYIQLLSTTNRDEAWADFTKTRRDVLGGLPPALSPTVVAGAYITRNATNPNSSGPSVSGAIGDVSNVEIGSGDSSFAAVLVAAVLNKWGPVIIGLLAANVLMVTILCIVAIVACTRGVIKGGAKSRSIGASYAPVRVKEAEPSLSETYHD